MQWNHVNSNLWFILTDASVPQKSWILLDRTHLLMLMDVLDAQLPLMTACCQQTQLTASCVHTASLVPYTLPCSQCLLPEMHAAHLWCACCGRFILVHTGKQQPCGTTCQRNNRSITCLQYETAAYTQKGLANPDAPPARLLVQQALTQIEVPLPQTSHNSNKHLGPFEFIRLRFNYLDFTTKEKRAMK